MWSCLAVFGNASTSVCFCAGNNRRSDDSRAEYAKELRRLLEAHLLKTPITASDPISEGIFARLSEFVKNDEQHIRVAGIIALDELVDLKHESYRQKSLRLVYSVRILLDENYMMRHHDEETARATVLLARSYVKFEDVHLKRFLSQVLANSIRQLVMPNHGLQTAFQASILTYLGDLYPADVLGKSAELTTSLCKMLINPSTQNHIQRRGALRTVLSICAEYSKTEGSMLQLIGLVEGAVATTLEPLGSRRASLSEGDGKRICGAFLAIGTVLSTERVNEFVPADLYARFFQLAVQFEDSRRSEIRIAVFQLLPKFAALSEMFSSHGFLSQCKELLLNHAVRVEQHYSSESARSAAVNALGDILQSLNSHDCETLINPCIDLAVKLVESPPSSAGPGWRRLVPLSTGLRFVKNVASRTEPRHPYFVNAMRCGLLGSLLHADFSQCLVEALHSSYKVVPELTAYVQNSLLTKFEKVLPPSGATETLGPGGISSAYLVSRAGELFSPSAGVVPSYRGISSGANNASASAGRGRNPSGSRHNSRPPDEVTPQRLLALRTLATFYFSNVPAPRLAWFTNSLVAHHLEHPGIDIRRETVRACVTLMEAATNHQDSGTADSTADHFQRSRSFRPDVYMILSQIATLALVDPGPQVRRTAVENLLIPSFEPYLGQVECVRTLSGCLYDENKEVRKAAVQLFCRVRKIDEAVVDPVLQNFLKHLLSSIRYCKRGPGEFSYDATILLQLLIRGELAFATMYIGPIMDALVLNLEEHLKVPAQTDVATTLPVLQAIGDLTDGLWSPTTMNTEPLIELLIRAVQVVQASDEKFRAAALRALSGVTRATAHGVNPYSKNKTLLRSLMTALCSRTELSSEVRGEILTLLGVLGAVNPEKEEYKYAALPMLDQRTDASGPGPEYPVRFINVAQPDATGGLVPNSGNSVIAKPASGPASSQNQDGRPTAHPAVRAGNATGQAKVAPGVATDRPPLLGNGAFANDLEWVERQLSATIPIWKRPTLQTESLVGTLLHPFTSSEYYYVAAVLDGLHKLVADCHIAGQETDAVSAIVSLTRVIKRSRTCGRFLPAIVPRLLWLVRPVEPTKALGQTFDVKDVLSELTKLVEIVKDDFAPYLSDTVALCYEYLRPKETAFPEAYKIRVLSLLAQLRVELKAAFRPYAVYVLEPMLQILVRDMSAERLVSTEVLTTISKFGKYIDQHLFIVIPAILKVVNDTSASAKIRTTAIATLTELAVRSPSANDMLSLILHPLIRIMGARGPTPGDSTVDPGSSLAPSSSSPLNLTISAADAITKILKNSRAKAAAFVPMIAKASLVSSLKQSEQPRKDLEAVLCDIDEDLVTSILKYVPAETKLPMSQIGGVTATENEAGVHDSSMSQSNVPDKYRLDHESLLEAFEYVYTQDQRDWTEWITRLGARLFKESPIPAIRAVANTAQLDSRFVKQLFNAAFLSCWASLLSADAQQRVVNVFSDALGDENLPMDVAQTLLDLFEFMDHDEHPLPVPIPLITRAAYKVGAYAKALRYRETEYQNPSQPVSAMRETMTSSAGLLEIYNQLGQSESAKGTIQHYCGIAGDRETAPIRRQYNETLKLLPEATMEYTSILNLLSEISIADVMPSSYENGAVAFSRTAGIHGASNGGIEPSLTLEGIIPYGVENLSREVLQAYRRDLKWYVTVAQLRCLDRLGEWRAMNAFHEKTWSEVEGNEFAKNFLVTEGRGASVAFDLGRWDHFKQRVDHIALDTWDGRFYRSLLCVADGPDHDQFAQARKHIQKARQILDGTLSTRASEGYPRAYGDVLNAQHLTELEEMIDLHRTCEFSSSNKARRDEHYQKSVAQLAKEWTKRLKNVKPDQNTWYRVLMIRSLVLSPSDPGAIRTWVDFVSMCRKNGRLPMANEALGMLVNSERIAREGGERVVFRGTVTELSKSCKPISEWSLDELRSLENEEIRFACIKHWWGEGRGVDAFNVLEETAAPFAPLLLESAKESPLFDLSDSAKEAKARKKEMYRSRKGATPALIGEMYLKLAKWSERLWTSNRAPARVTRTSILGYAFLATCAQPQWFKAWHTWATLNVQEAARCAQLAGGEHSRDTSRSFSARPAKAGNFTTDIVDWDATSNEVTLDPRRREYLERGIIGYFNAIRFGGKTGLEDALTLLTLWFRYGADRRLADVFDAYFKQSSANDWVDVVPQIIARLQTKVHEVQTGVQQLLTRIGQRHPQIAVFPLTVATNTPGESLSHRTRKRNAEEVLRRIQEMHRDIVDHARLVSTELNRVAVLSLEEWYDRIEEASRLYYAEHDIDGMLNFLRPLHESLMRNPPETKWEKHFRSEFGSDLAKAYDHCEQYRAIKLRLSQENNTDEEALKIAISHIDRAWECYYTVFRAIQKRQNAMNKLDLGEVSSKLKDVDGLSLAVPGTYKTHKESNVVRIARFEPELDVIQSKQRPRKIKMYGSDGKSYSFLLKGHDDLRQDERVMQVFKLMNDHLRVSDDRSVRSGAELKGYTVVALSPKSGLIEWVEDCDTMHVLVKDFRENRKIIPNIEHKFMVRVAPEPDRLPLLHKVDLFEYMRANTGGRDIARVLWLRSRNSEIWLDRRTGFARTLATSSIAGYILGLGDRHPSNIMISRSTGKIMHIDFGDCFEVAMKREKFPEKVPFRLTRMLVLALEPCGIPGYFTHTAVAMMKVLRQENTRKALMAMMQAFVYDPLIRQKLLSANELNAIEKERAVGLPASVRPSGALPDMLRAGATLQEATDAVLGGSAAAVRDPVGDAQRNFTPAEISRRGASQARDRGVHETKQFNEMAHQRAVSAVQRVAAKLTGRDFDPAIAIDEENQVNKLIEQAQSIENLCQLFPGWVASW